MLHCLIPLAPDQGRLRAVLFARNVVLSEQYNEQGQGELEIRLPRSDFFRIVAGEGFPAEALLASAKILE
jgi:GTP-binding protein HflX